MKVLFVCRENVGRSQMAEALFNQLAKEQKLAHYSISAGTNARDYEHYREPLRDLIVACLDEVGIDVSKSVSKQLTPEIAKTADKIIMMAEPELLPDYLKNNPKVQYWKVPDMKYEDLEFHRKTREQIKLKVQELLKSL